MILAAWRGTWSLMSLVKIMPGYLILLAPTRLCSMGRALRRTTHCPLCSPSCQCEPDERRDSSNASHAHSHTYPVFKYKPSDRL